MSHKYFPKLENKNIKNTFTAREVYFYIQFRILLRKAATSKSKMM